MIMRSGAKEKNLDRASSCYPIDDSQKKELDLQKQELPILTPSTFFQAIIDETIQKCSKYIEASELLIVLEKKWKTKFFSRKTATKYISNIQENESIPTSISVETKNLENITKGSEGCPSSYMKPPEIYNQINKRRPTKRLGIRNLYNERFSKQLSIQRTNNNTNTLQPNSVISLETNNTFNDAATESKGNSDSTKTVTKNVNIIPQLDGADESCNDSDTSSLSSSTTSSGTSSDSSSLSQQLTAGAYSQVLSGHHIESNEKAVQIQNKDNQNIKETSYDSDVTFLDELEEDLSRKKNSRDDLIEKFSVSESKSDKDFLDEMEEFVGIEKKCDLIEKFTVSDSKSDNDFLDEMEEFLGIEKKCSNEKLEIEEEFLDEMETFLGMKRKRENDDNFSSPESKTKQINSIQDNRNEVVTHDKSYTKREEHSIQKASESISQISCSRPVQDEDIKETTKCNKQGKFTDQLDKKEEFKSISKQNIISTCSTTDIEINEEQFVDGDENCNIVDQTHKSQGKNYCKGKFDSNLICTNNNEEKKIETIQQINMMQNKSSLRILDGIDLEEDKNYTIKEHHEKFDIKNQEKIKSIPSLLKNIDFQNGQDKADARKDDEEKDYLRNQVKSKPIPSLLKDIDFADKIDDDTEDDNEIEYSNIKEKSKPIPSLLNDIDFDDDDTEDYNEIEYSNTIDKSKPIPSLLNDIDFEADFADDEDDKDDDNMVRESINYQEKSKSIPSFLNDIDFDDDLYDNTKDDEEEECIKNQEQKHISKDFQEISNNHSKRIASLVDNLDFDDNDKQADLEVSRNDFSDLSNRRNLIEADIDNRRTNTSDKCIENKSMGSLIDFPKEFNDTINLETLNSDLDEDSQYENEEDHVLWPQIISQFRSVSRSKTTWKFFLINGIVQYPVDLQPGVILEPGNLVFHQEGNIWKKHILLKVLKNDLLRIYPFTSLEKHYVDVPLSQVKLMQEFVFRECVATISL